MPSTYSSSLRLELQATGENSNSWGTKTNNNLNLIEQAISGYEAITLVSASSTYNLTIADASSSPGRNAFIEFRGTVASAISIVVPDVEKGYWVKNSATGAALTFRTSSGTGFTLPSNDWIFIITDGTSAFPVTTSLTNYARINSANTFTGANTFTSVVDIQANTSITGNIFVSGVATLASAVDIKGATSLASTLVVGGNATLNGSVSVSGSFAVSGASTFTSVVNIRANASVVGNFLVSGATTLASSVDIKGATSLASTLVVGGNTVLNGSVSVSGSFAVSGASTFTSVVNIRANASVVGNFLVSGATTLASTVDIKGATSLASTLFVGGAATFREAVSVSGNFAFAGRTFVVGEGFPADNIRTSLTMNLQGGYINCYNLAAGGIPGNLKIESTNLELACNVSITGPMFVQGNPILVSSAGIVLGNGTTGGGTNTLAIVNGTVPTLSTTNGILLYAQDVAASSELKVRDEAGNITTLSPHNFSLCGGPSEEMAWSYYSERSGKAVNIDIMRLARLIENLTGEKLVYIENLT